MTPLRSLVAVIALLVLPLDALATTELDRFHAKVRKSAPSGGAHSDVDVTPPVVCVCKEAGQFFNMAGQLRSHVFEVAPPLHAVAVACVVLLFRAETEESVRGGIACSDDWVLLPK